MRLTPRQVTDIFGDPGVDSTALRENWFIAYRAQNDGGLELRDALELVRNQPREVAAFVEKVLQPVDLADVEYVIEKLCDDAKNIHFQAHESLRMLQAWRAKTLMQIVIDKRNADRLCDWVSENWHLAYRAHNAGSLDVRGALEMVRNQLHDVSAFVEKVLQPVDLADVEYVIEMLVEEDAVNRIWDRKCLRLLQAWRARTLMQIVIEKRNAMNVKLGTHDIQCD